MKVSVANFQALRKVSLEVTGFTVLTGPTDRGKSALVRAIRGAFFGFPGDFYVRRGESIGGVNVTFADTAIKWRKVPTGKKAPGRETSLEIGGNLFTKIGKDHAKLTEPIGLKELQLSDSRLCPQVALQFDMPFMLAGISDTGVAEAFKLLGRGDVVTDARKMAKSDQRQVEVELELRKKDLLDLEVDIAARLPVRALYTEVDAFKNDFFTIEKSMTTRKELVGLIQELDGLKDYEVPELSVDTDKAQEAIEVWSILMQYIGIPDLEIPEVPKEVSRGYLELLESVMKLQNLESEIQAISGDIDQKDIRAKEIDKEEGELRIALGKCPLCNGSLL